MSYAPYAKPQMESQANANMLMRWGQTDAIISFTIQVRKVMDRKWGFGQIMYV